MPSYKWRSLQSVIKKEYIQGIVEVTDEGDRHRSHPTVEELTEKYGVPAVTIRDWIYSEGWVNLRQQHIERQNAELIQEGDWYLQERIRSDSLSLDLVKQLMQVVRKEMDDFKGKRSGTSVAQLEKNGRVIGGLARALKDLKVTAELALTSKDGSAKTLSESAARSTDEVKRELEELIQRHKTMR